jgi:hypothetical protein
MLQWLGLNPYISSPESLPPIEVVIVRNSLVVEGQIVVGQIGAGQIYAEQIFAGDIYAGVK